MIDSLYDWESGADINYFHNQISDFLAHYRFKSIASREYLNVFSPNNVYSPATSCEGITPLNENNKAG
ncbi:hypothetical protein [Photobacterium leiognathi]|uniref:hypothetical protein n=1 Tax=Photobacterium leiognathi TaxID=553611 RepID=UPI002981CD3A|nr:hypothetical protein [Photobacterium leiognathi]